MFSIAPRKVHIPAAAAVRRHIRCATTTLTPAASYYIRPTHTSPITYHTQTVLRRRTYTTMSSATSFYDFKPADSTLRVRTHTTCLTHYPRPPSAPTHTLLPPSFPCISCNTNPSSKRRAPPTRSRTSKTKSSSSSTLPANAASRRNSQVSKNSTKISKPRTPTISKSSGFRATSSADRTRGPTTRSSRSAR
jgi:hypothetical protein